MSRVSIQLRDYLEGALSEPELDELLTDLARRVLEHVRPLPGAPALVMPPGEPPVSVAASIVEDELDRVARLVTPPEFERLCDQVAAVLGDLPPREPDSLGRFTTPIAPTIHDAPTRTDAVMFLMDMDAGPPPAADDMLANSYSDLQLPDLPVPQLGALGGAPRDELDEFSAAPTLAPGAAKRPPLGAPPAPSPAPPFSPPPPPPLPPPPPPAPAVSRSLSPPPPPPAPEPPAVPAFARARRTAQMRSVSTSVVESSVGAGSSGSTLPALPPTSAPVALVVDAVVPLGVWLFLLRVLIVGAHTTGGLGWLVAAIAYAGRAERLHAAKEKRGAGGSALGSVGCALLALLSALR